MLTFRRAGYGDLDEISRVSSEAFFDYDFYSFFEDDPDKRWDFIYEMQRICLLVNLKRDQVFVGEEDGKIVTVIALQEPGKKQAGFFEYFSSGVTKVIGEFGFFRVLSWFCMDMTCEKPIEKLRERTKNYYYLHNFTVRKDLHGEGRGSRAIREFIYPYIKKKGGGTLTLITNSERNVRFYLRNGFKCYHKGRVMYNGRWLGNWAFRKKL